ncbi:MAG TPA: ATP-binding protein [Kofleriaceae bacterium]|nr:ATP-binding protein [Kofleriaceae bacterium]
MTGPLARFSLRVRMVAVFGFLILVVALFMVEFFPARMAEQAQAQAELRARTMTQVMASAVAPALEFDDAANAAKVLAWLGSSPDARFAVVLADGGARFATWSPERVPAQLPQLAGAASVVHGDLLITSAPVVGRGGGRGTLVVGQSLDRLVQDRSDARATVVSATAVVLVLGLFACIVLATALVRPLERLTTIARDIARGAKPPRIAGVAGVAGGREVVDMTNALGMMLERLNEANHQLVEASRHAGMAEVATGVLHNVGNILTSVNVGIDVLNERARELPVERVRRAGELLGAAQTQGPIDPAKLDAGLRYLTAIAGALDADRGKLLGGLATLRDHIGHINRVVTAQNGYARTGGVLEQIELATLIEQAIGLGCADSERHGLEIARRVDEGLAVTVDRHRVLQILVNLLANARDSITQLVKAGTETARRITITASVDGGSLVLAVEDTGGGIAPESLLKIFTAGFTTKPKGHGYGLHSSALAAEQLGGTLRCSSEGLGRGAMFILRVPTEPGRSHE